MPADFYHSERSRGIWSRTKSMAHPQPRRDARFCVSTIARCGKRRGTAFTLIELLVVISIIALLMAILMPALARVRRQAKSLGCQAKLRQWGLALKCYTDENDGKFWRDSNPVWRDSSATPETDSVFWCRLLGTYYAGNRKILLCPMAARRFTNDSEWFEWNYWGATFMPWFTGGIPPYNIYGSYGMNARLSWVQELSTSPVGHQAEIDWNRRAWKTSLVRGANNIPAVLDSIYWESLAFVDSECPPAEELPAYEKPKFRPVGIQCECINRHDGGINGLFMDWSVRKVGLKELWTLKWHREFNTGGKWTKAGGVQPDDWPAWMRKFKEY